MNQQAQSSDSMQENIRQLSFSPVVLSSIQIGADCFSETEAAPENTFTLTYIKKGNGVDRILHTDVVLHPFCLILTKPGIPHRIISQTEDSERLVLRFRLTSDRHLLTPSPEYSNFHAATEALPFLSLQLTRKNDFHAILDRIIKERQKAHIWDDIMVNLLLTELLVLFVRNVYERMLHDEKKPSLKMKELLRSAKAYMEQNYNKPVSLAEVARSVYLSESYLAHSFRREFGISPKSFLLQIRISAAKKLLQESRMKIGDIALAVGFSGQQRFNAIFKKTVHMTPLKYRKEIQKTERNKKENDL